MKAWPRWDGVIKFSDCADLLRLMMEDLDKVHAQRLLHRDISPDNIMIQFDCRVKLLNLRAAKYLTLQREGVSQLVTKKGSALLSSTALSCRMWANGWMTCGKARE